MLCFFYEKNYILVDDIMLISYNHTVILGLLYLKDSERAVLGRKGYTKDEINE